MNDKQRLRYERLVRAFSYGAEHAPDFPPTTRGGQAHARLGEAIAAAEEQDAAGITNQRAGQQSTTRREVGREALQTALAAISDTAATIGLDYPEVRDGFRRMRSNVTDQTLIGTARSFAAAALPLKARFIEYDLPPDFLERLDEQIDSFEEAIGAQTAHASARVAATAALEDALKRGEQELEKLDTAVRNKFSGDPSKLAAWESARRMERTGRSKKSGDTPAPPVA
jgi:hypothetical protein